MQSTENAFETLARQMKATAEYVEEREKLMRAQSWRKMWKLADVASAFGLFIVTLWFT